MTAGMWAALAFGMLTGVFAMVVNEVLVNSRRSTPESGNGSIRVGGVEEFLLATGYLPSLVEERDIFAQSLVEAEERYRWDVKRGWFERAAREGDLMLAIREHLADLDESIALQAAEQAQATQEEEEVE